MKNNRRNHKAGFTLAELLMTIAILAVLFGIGFVNVIRYQRQLKLTENNDIAREIFTAAQNRMTVAKANGTWSDDNTNKMGTIPSDFGDATKATLSTTDVSADALWDTDNYVYIIHKSGDPSSPDFLPLGVIDESVRTDSSYVIEYNKKTAAVYGVWYLDPKTTGYSINYTDIVDVFNATRPQKGDNEDEAKKKKNVRIQNRRDGSILGYYGGAVATDDGSNVVGSDVKLAINNSDTLSAVISVDDDALMKQISEIKLTVEGMTSGASKTETLYGSEITDSIKDFYFKDEKNNVFTIVLDSITLKDGHFAKRYDFGDDNTTSFIPGEDIRVTASFTLNGKLVKRSAVTNSLFASIQNDSSQTETKYKQAEIAYTRHLQNLSPVVSGMSYEGTADTNSVVISSAELIQNINFDDFLGDRTVFEKLNVTSSAAISIYSKDGSTQDDGKFYAISNYTLAAFNGNNHKLSNFDISVFDSDTKAAGDSGLFANAGPAGDGDNGALDIKNFLLENFCVEGKRNVGTLVGTAGRGSIENVAVYVTDINNTSITEIYKSGSWDIKNSIWSSGSTQHGVGVWSKGDKGTAGGLIGSINSTGETARTAVTNSFASVPVRSSGNSSIAGGLVGSINTDDKAVNISSSYAGGYVEKSAKDPNTANYSLHSINVISGNKDNGITGGLIGEVSGTNLTLNDVYSTASAAGHISGGLIGSNRCNNLKINNAYSTGTVYGLGANYAAGYFIGTQAASYQTSDQNKVGYLHNGKNEQDANGFVYASNAVGSGNDAGTVAFTYEQLDGTDTLTLQVKEHAVNDKDHTHKYNAVAEVYPFPAVTTMDNDPANNYAHYGDWPSKIDLESARSFDGDFGILYYEKVQHGYDANNVSYYYHGYVGYEADNIAEGKTQYQEVSTRTTLDDIISPGPLNAHGLVVNHGEYVVEQGYLVLAGDDLENTDQNHLLMRYISNDYTINLTESNMDLIKNGQAAEYPEIIGQTALNIHGYKCYKILTDSNTSTWVLAGKQTHLQFARYKNGRVNWDNAARFAFSPLFSDLSLEGGNGQTSITTHSYSIRSAETLNTLIGSNFWVQGEYSDLKITFDLDIDYDPRIHFSSFSKNLDNNNTVELWNPGYTSPHIQEIKGDISATSYNGQLYTMRYLTQQIASNMNTGNLHDLHIIKYEPVDHSQYLIGGTSNNSTVKNITIDDSTGLLLGSFKGKMENVTVNKLVLYNDIDTASDPNKLWGIIGEVQNGNISDLKINRVSLGSIPNLCIGVFGKIMSGTVDGVTVNMLTSPDNGFAVENYATVKNVTINNLMTGASGFVNINGGSAEIDTIKINNVQAGTNGFAETNNGKIKKVTIRGLGAGISGFVNNNGGQGSVDNVVINGATIGKYGFGEINDGKITNCQIFGKRYEDVKVGSETVDLAVGFVKETKGAGTIQRSSITGTVTGKSVAGFIGTQSNNNGGNYTEDCYSNVIINTTGGNPVNGVDAAGFVLDLRKGGVANSHSIGMIRATSTGEITAAGFAGGIATEDAYNTKFDNNYAAIWDNSGVTNYGLIYVNNNKLSFVASAKTIPNTIAQNVNELAMLSADQLDTVSPDLTKVYRQYGDPAVSADITKYPYSMPVGMTAYGDWDSVNVLAQAEIILNMEVTVSSYRNGVAAIGEWSLRNIDGTACNESDYYMPVKDGSSIKLIVKKDGKYVLHFEQKVNGNVVSTYNTVIIVKPLDITVKYNGSSFNTVYLNSSNKDATATAEISAYAEGAQLNITSPATTEGSYTTAPTDHGTVLVTFKSAGKYKLIINTDFGSVETEITVGRFDEGNQKDAFAALIKDEGNLHAFDDSDSSEYELTPGVIYKIGNDYYAVDTNGNYKPNEKWRFIKLDFDSIVTDEDVKNTSIAKSRGAIYHDSTGFYYITSYYVLIGSDYKYTDAIKVQFTEYQSGTINGTLTVNPDALTSRLSFYTTEVTAPSSISSPEVNTDEPQNSDITISNKDEPTNLIDSGEETYADTNSDIPESTSSESSPDTEETTIADSSVPSEPAEVVSNTASTVTAPSEPAAPEQPLDTEDLTGTEQTESSADTEGESSDPSSSPVSAVSDSMMHRYASVLFVPYQFSLDEPGITEDPEGEEGKNTSTVILPGGSTGFTVDASPVDTESPETSAEAAETFAPAETPAPEETSPAVAETAEPAEQTAIPAAEEQAESFENKPDAEYDVVTGETFDLSVMNPVREGYTLVGWRVLNAGEGIPLLTASVNTVNGKQDVTYSYAPDTVITVTGDLQLEAVWSLNDTAFVSETAGSVDLTKYMNSSAGNPYPLHWDNCTWSAWTLCKAYTGISLPGWGDAKYWYARAQKAGFKTGSAPAVNSIVCFDNHVGFISAVSEDGQYAYIQEGNWGGTYHEGWWPAYSDRHSLKLYGYIYLGEYEPNAEILVPDAEEIEKQVQEQEEESQDIDYNDPVSSEEPVITPTPEPTAEPTAAPEHTAEPTPTVTPEHTEEAMPTPTATPEHTAEPTPTATPEHTAEPTPTPTNENTAEPIPEQSAEPTVTPESTATPEVTAEPAEIPAETAVPEETAQPTPEPTALETEMPEETAAAEETAVPSEPAPVESPPVEEVDIYAEAKAACTEPSWWNDVDHVCVVPEPTEEPVVVETSEQPVNEAVE